MEETYEQKYKGYWDWSEAEGIEEEREILLNEFKQDLNKLDNDLEKGMLDTQLNIPPKRLAPPPKMTKEEKQKSKV
jgi:hypothetical protein